MADRVVNLGVRAVHRATDKGGAGGGAGYAGSAGCPHRERRRADHSGPERRRFFPGRRGSGAGEMGRFRTASSGGGVAVHRMLSSFISWCSVPPSTARTIIPWIPVNFLDAVNQEALFFLSCYANRTNEFDCSYVKDIDQTGLLPTSTETHVCLKYPALYAHK